MVYLQLFLTFLKIGAFTIGGGYAMLPLINDAVTAQGWATTTEITDFIAVAESTPGPFAVNLATFVGYNAGGILGTVCTVFGLFLPSFVIILCVFKLAQKFLKNKFVLYAMDGLRPAVAALIYGAFVTVAFAAFYSAPLYDTTGTVNNFAIGWFLVCFASLRIFKNKLHPVLLIAISAVAGIMFGM